MQLLASLNQHRRIIFALLIMVLVVALLLMPSVIVEAGKAVSTGG